MRKYDGVVIHRTHDEDGIVEIVQGAATRSMHFGTPAKQSCMSLDDPDRLELAYLRAMMSCLLFKSSPHTVLIIGLGGGSLAKFLLQRFTDCRIEVVEPRRSIKRLAHAYFSLPDDDRMSIHRSDGCRFVMEIRRQWEAGFDLILVDAYDANGMAFSINRPVFFDTCAELLRSDGVMAINLWGNQPDTLEQSMAGLNQSFDNRVLRLPVKGRANIIGLGMSHGMKRRSLKSLRQRAEQLALQLDLEFPLFLRQLKHQNRPVIKRLLI